MFSTWMKVGSAKLEAITGPAEMLRFLVGCEKEGIEKLRRRRRRKVYVKGMGVSTRYPDSRGVNLEVH